MADSSNGYTVDFSVYIGKAAGQRISEFGLGYDVVMRLMRPFLHQCYHLYVDNFYTSFPLFKDLFAQGVPATGTISEKRRGFPDALKKGVPWVPDKNRGAMRWVRDPPCLVLQWVDSKVVSLLSTIERANDHGFVNRKRKDDDVWAIREVQQPKVIANYNKYMNGVDHSDQILATNTVLHKIMKWWKNMVFHLIDMAVVNGFILFKEHQTQFPDDEALKMPSHYSLGDFREEIARQLCGFPDYGSPPENTTVKSPPSTLGDVTTVHIPVFSDTQRRCVVCYKEGKGDFRVRSYCNAPQCQKYMHVSKGWDCFAVFHSKNYHR